MAIVELVNGRQTIIAINKVMKQHQIAMQMGIAAALTRTRLRAEEYVIPNTTTYVNTRWARKEQASTPGRLTSRTGKLKYMLRHKASSGNLLKNWKGFGNILVKERSVALMGQVKMQKLTISTHQYVGTYRVNVLGNGHLFSTSRKRPQESLKTLAIRFQWEYGIRGEKRPIFSPVSKQADFDLRKYVEQKNNLIWRL